MPDIKDSYTRRVFERFCETPPTATGMVIYGMRIALAALCDRIMGVEAPYQPFSTTLNEWLIDILDWSDDHGPEGTGEATLGQLAGRLQGAWAVPEFYRPPHNPLHDQWDEIRRALVVLPWAIEAYAAGRHVKALMFCRHATEVMESLNEGARMEFARLHNHLKTVEDR